jgi:membrane protein YqaA with SNARE-associated domain
MKMTRKIHRSTWAPMFALIAGSAIAISVGAGEHRWKFLLIAEIVTVLGAAVLYLIGRGDSDVADVAGGRADERQKLIALKASRLSQLVGLGATLLACVIAAASKKSFWPYEVLFVVIGLSYWAGIGIYGSSEVIPEDEDDRVAS